MKRKGFNLAATFAVVATGVFSLGSTGEAAQAAAGRGSGAPVTVRHITSAGTTNVRALSRQIASRNATSHNSPRPQIRGVRPSRHTSVPVPNPSTTPIASGSGGAQGFVGVTVLSQAEAANGNQYTVEPPDQGLCAAKGLIVEPVNVGLQMYTEAGQAVTPVLGLNEFFHLPPEINFAYNPPTFGPFLSDPRCYYDAQTGRWFLSVLEIDINPYSGQFGYRSAEFFAVSQTSDPTGTWGLFMIDSTNDGNDGTPAEANCPCFGDQPRIGADANGFYITDDVYPIHGLFNSNGGELYAVSKSGIASAADGGPLPVLVDIHTGAVVIQGYPSNAIQPALIPAGGSYAPNTEYGLSTPDFNGFATSGGVGAQSLVLWALQGTSTLSSSTPSVTLTDSIMPSESFATPVAATQKSGPTPYASSIGASEAQLTVNDDRMEQVEYANGHLYSAVNTGIGPSNTANRSGVAWFVVTPSGSSGTVSHQGYVALGSGGSILYPAIGVDSSGDGVMTFSISGPSWFPSAAFMQFDNTSPTGSIFVASKGTAPEDGFTCYSQAGFGPTCRWGDYSAASSDGAGHIVLGTELIPDSARAVDSNWGTFVGVLKSF